MKEWTGSYAVAIVDFPPSLSSLFRNRWYFSAQPATGSWLMGDSSWISSLHIAPPHLLRTANKRLFEGSLNACECNGGKSRSTRNPSFIILMAADSDLLLYLSRRMSARCFLLFLHFARPPPPSPLPPCFVTLLSFNTAISLPLPYRLIRFVSH